MDFPNFIVIGMKNGGYMVAKLLDAAENYYEEVVRGDTDKYFSISELVFNANANYEKSINISYSPYDDIF